MKQMFKNIKIIFSLACCMAMITNNQALGQVQNQGQAQTRNMINTNIVESPDSTMGSAETKAAKDSVNFNPQAPALELWGIANQAYLGGDYEKAIQAYQTILSQGKHSAKLYYNLGNAYFKQNSLGRSILNYNRALRLTPSDKDVQHNLALASSRTVDKIESVPEFFVKSWLRNLGGLMTSSSWATLGLIFFGVALWGAVVWLLGNRLWARKMGFYSGLLFVVLALVAVVYAWQIDAQLTENIKAVVITGSTPVKSSPAKGGKDIFILHEGTTIRRGEWLDGWSQVTLPNGNSGWVESSTIETI